MDTIFVTRATSAASFGFDLYLNGTYLAQAKDVDAAIGRIQEHARTTGSEPHLEFAKDVGEHSERRISGAINNAATRDHD